jgi:hypothetical protein
MSHQPIRTKFKNEHFVYGIILGLNELIVRDARIASSIGGKRRPAWGVSFDWPGQTTYTCPATNPTNEGGSAMRVVIRASLVGLALGLAACPAGADGKKDRTPELEAAAKAFLKAYQAKDLDALMETADAPFLVGTLRDPKVLKKGADLGAELKSRLSRGGKFPALVAKTLTWDKAITTQLGADEERRTRERLKPALEITGAGGGYAALADTVAGAKGRKQLAISNTRLLVGIRDGKAKVVGILVDDPGPH